MNQVWRDGAKIHVPVMPSEVLSYLNISKDGTYVDGTIGLGGHSSLILPHLSTKGHLIGIDRDVEALEICKKGLSKYQSTLSLFNESYHNLDSILDQLEIDSVNGILLDLGLSSFQLDSQDRGFSYKIDSELDMRFDKSQKTNANQILNKLPEKELADILFFNGEERRSRGIARSIIRMRPLLKVSDLVESIRKSTPPSKRNKSIARVFQAIRIAVNDELKILDIFLSSFCDRLIEGGRIVIISFHSLEDRKVKHCFRSLKHEQKLSILTKKPLIPTQKEIFNNKKSKSAKLRAAERIL